MKSAHRMICYAKEAKPNRVPTRIGVDTPMTDKLTGKRCRATIEHKDGQLA